MNFKYSLACLIIILAAAVPTFAGSGAGLPASYYYIREPVKALDLFVEAHHVDMPVANGTERTGIATGQSPEGPVYLEITRSAPGGTFRYTLTISRAKEIEGRTKDNTISFDLNYVTEATGRPGRILLSWAGEFDEANHWELAVDANSKITGVDANYHGRQFLFGGKKLHIAATF